MVITPELLATDRTRGTVQRVSPVLELSTGHLSVRWYRSIDEISSSLFEACFPPPLEGGWWYSALEKGGLENQFRFEYAVVFSDREPIAIAPTFLMNVPMDLVVPEFLIGTIRFLARLIPGFDYQRTLFVGSPCADEGTVGMLPGVTLSDLLPTLRTAFEERARELKVSVIAWKDFAQHDCEQLDKLTEGGRYFKMPSYPGTVVPLPSGGFSEYLDTLSHAKRYNLKKKLRRSKARGELVASVIQRPDKATQSEIFGLFWQTYERGKTKFEQLTPECFALLADCDCSNFVLLRQPDTGKLVAFMLLFDMKDRVINKFIGLDYSLGGDWFLYFRLWEAAVSWAMSLGAIELQSGQTGYRAKLDVGNHLVPLTNYCMHRNPLMHFIYRALSPTVSWSSLDEDLAVHVKAHPDE